MNITQQEYTAEIELLAQSCIDDCTDIDDIGSYVHETVDGHRWIIYTAYHADIVRLSDSNEAYLDVYCNEDLGQLVTDNGPQHIIMVQAFFAMCQDVNESIHALQHA